MNLYSFVGSPNDGSCPQAGLMQGSDGNFYGTTLYGGTNGDGTVFRISPSGSHTNLYSFAGGLSDGANPYAGLVQGSDGNFYGTTLYGGANDNGTVFRISPSGSYTILYSFAGAPNDGSNPSAGLVQGSDGNFYGTTIPAGRTATAPCFGSVPAAATRLFTPLLSPPTMEAIHLPGWCRAATAISTGQPFTAARTAWAPCFGSVPAVATRIFTPLPAIPPMGRIQCRAGAGQRQQFLRDDPLRRDEQGRHRVSDQSQRQLHESVLLCRRPHDGSIHIPGW